MRSGLALLPALLIAYLLMILAWPWSALAPLNPIRGLLDFSEFQYHIRTLLAGQIYEMASVPRLYVPIYILIRVPLLTLVGAGLALVFMMLPRRLQPGGASPVSRPEVAIIALAVGFPLACQVICHGPAFTGMRHFLFVIPSIAVLAGRMGIPVLPIFYSNDGLGYEGLLTIGRAILRVLPRRRFYEDIAAHSRFPYQQWWLEETNPYALSADDAA